jgi:excisionase family DNA binding protein
MDHATTDSTAGIYSREVLSVNELAKLLGVDRKTIYEYAARGQIPHRRLGRRMLFSRAAVMSWLAACKVATTGKAL